MINFLCNTLFICPKTDGGVTSAGALKPRQGEPIVKKLILTSAALALSVTTALTPVAFAQESADAEARQETIVITGTRRAARSAKDSPVPVDVVTAADLQAQSGNDVTELLRTSVPSYNVNTQPISDAATLIRPVNLRGLSPDHTLVLVNGKRMHRASVIAFLGGGVSDGAQGPDVSTIPSIALKQVDILRDGASSQYGSDAIAGVINFTLDDSSEGGRVQAKIGSTYEGDGNLYQLAGNIGLPVGDSGFLNLSAEYGETDATSRSVQRTDAANLIAAGNTAVADPAQIWGQPSINGDLKLYANFGYDVNENLEIYSFGNISERQTNGGFFFRNPTNRGGVYNGPLLNNDGTNALNNLAAVSLIDADGDSVTSLGGIDDIARIQLADMGILEANLVDSILVGNMDGQSAAACPTGIPLTGTGGLIPDAGVLAQVTADDNCFSFVELFPGGFTPRFGGKLEDQSFAIGARGVFDIGTGLNYDFSARYGENQIDFFIRNTINASLGSNTPTSFNPGGYGQIESVYNADFSYGLPVAAFASDLNVAFGFENRSEQFEIRQGDGASFEIGPLAAVTTAFPTGQGFSSSSNGFGGFTPTSAGKSEQTANGVYVDLEADVTDALLVQAAVRYEDYDTFGGDTNYKIAGQYDFTDNFSVRAAYSTGYHVPTAGQANVTNVTTQLVGGVLTDTGTFPLSSAAGQLAATYVSTAAENGGLGEVRPTLTPEQAENITLGAVFGLGDFSVTLDYFNIKLEDRISRSSNIEFLPALQLLASTNNYTLMSTTTSQAIIELNNRGLLVGADFAGAEDLSSFAFFNNAFDTTTSGVDIVVNGPLNFVPGGNTELTFAANFTQTEVDRFDKTISAERIKILEEGLPGFRANTTVTHDRGPLTFMGRVNYFGEGYDSSSPTDIDAAFIVDVEVGYALANGIDFKFGVANLLDQYPNDNPNATSLGSAYPESAAYGFNGGTYYLKAGYTF